ncbi:hypothetical protein SFR_7014 (plasmid) [Streptomyces sp. FR-008]|nr:hypothetical protein SFR_7014 [Streptomyces sp. FR-008]
MTGDVADVRAGTMQEGIHLGALAGTLGFVQHDLTGLETLDVAVWLGLSDWRSSASRSATAMTGTSACASAHGGRGSAYRSRSRAPCTSCSSAVDLPSLGAP